MSTHTWPWPPPDAGALAAASLVRPGGIRRAARRAFLLAFAFLEVGFALGDAVGAAAAGDAACSVGEGDAVSVGVPRIGVSMAAGVATVGVPIAAGVVTVGVSMAAGVATVGVSIAAGVATVGVSMAAGAATVGVSIAAGEFSRGGLFERYWAMPKAITAVTEAIPAAIAQRARRWVC